MVNAVKVFTLRLCISAYYIHFKRVKVKIFTAFTITAIREATRRFFNDESISSTTKERFRLHYINGERVLDISERHGVQSSSVCKGLKKSLNKFKEYFFLCVREIMEG